MSGFKVLLKKGVDRILSLIFELFYNFAMSSAAL